MARTITEWDVFGVKYRTRDYSAAFAANLIEERGDPEPRKVLIDTEVLDGESWHSLSDNSNINKFIADKAGILPPQQVLKVIMAHVTRLQFDWLDSWEGVKMPRRFQSLADSIISDNVPSMISTIIGSELATLRELEEYYSLKDLFLMLESLTVKNVNAALAHEEAEEAAKRVANR